MARKVLRFPEKGKLREALEFRDEKWDWILPMEIRYVEALMLVAQMALALKHPANDGQGAEAGRLLGRRLVERFLSDIPEFTMDHVKMFGWDRIFDIR